MMKTSRRHGKTPVDMRSEDHLGTGEAAVDWCQERPASRRFRGPGRGSVVVQMDEKADWKPVVVERRGERGDGCVGGGVSGYKENANRAKMRHKLFTTGRVGRGR